MAEPLAPHPVSGRWRPGPGVALVVLLAVGLLLRLWAITWGLPGIPYPGAPPFHPDELVPYAKGATLYDAPDAETFSWGGVFYLRIAHLALRGLAAAAPLPPGMEEASRLILCLRALNLLLCLGTALLLWSGVKPLQGARTAAVAAGLVLLFPGSVVSSLFARPDALLGFFGALALFSALRHLATGRRGWLAAGGVSAGFAAGTMAWGALAVVPMAAACIAGASVRRERIAGLAIVCVTAAGGYLAASGESVVYWGPFVQGLRRASGMQGGVGFHLPVAYAVPVSLYAFGTAATAAAWCGVAGALAGRRREMLVAAAWLAAGFVLLGGIGPRFIRYLLPLAPAVAVLGASVLAGPRLSASGPGRWAPAAVLVLTGLGSAGLVAPLGGGSDVRLAAGSWFDGAPPGSTVAVTESFIGDWTYVPRFPAGTPVVVRPVLVREGADPSRALTPGPDFVVTSDFAVANARGEGATRFFGELREGGRYRPVARIAPPILPSLPELVGFTPPPDLLYVRPTFLIYSRDR